MGAIEQGGYVFEIEFSQIAKTAALHVKKQGQFVRELSFRFDGNEPTQQQIEEKIEEYLNMLSAEDVTRTRADL